VALGDLVGRATVVVLFSAMAARFVAYFLATGRVTGLFLVASELLVVVLTIVRRRAVDVDRAWWARTVTLVSVAGPLLLRPGAGPSAVADWITGLLAAAGLLVVIGGKMCLGRSFGLVPANRGVVDTGLYRLVRHPIYLGYLMTHVAIVMAFPTVRNIAVFLVADTAQIVRALREERTLMRDPAYLAYMRRVTWRLVPGLF